MPLVLLLALPFPAVADGNYLSAEIDKAGQLQITTTDHRVIVAEKRQNQVGFSQPAISEDKTTIGWLALYPNCCTSYPIPLALVIFKAGRMVQTFGNGFPVWAWSFQANGKQAAFRQETVHGHLGVRYELRDIASGHLLAEQNGDPDDKSPKWVLDLVD